MVAVANVEVGIAQTLISLMPVLIIPILWFGYKQKTSLRGISGAGIAIIGVAILIIT
jgi:drug/metabolite transporter (DMT)-like permease